jgi:predicted GH43/DUF377 family glycosyl hydrolase
VPFSTGAIEALTIARPPGMLDTYLLSPFVWRESTYKMLLRVVPRRDDPALKIARVHYAQSVDGLHFSLEADPAIAPGPGDEDKDGCEDPTVCVVDGAYTVYYTGWNQTRKRGQLMLAAGTGISHLEKIGIALPWTPERQNPKEATVVPAADGTWRMFFEYAADGRSKIGVATALRAQGPWTVSQPLFEARDGSWDSWHLSTGPIERSPSGEPVMFYNGATHDAKWRIGWIAFDAQYSRATGRCAQPLIEPPSAREEGATDIAFAASAVAGDGCVHLYYSVADKDLYRAGINFS